MNNLARIVSHGFAIIVVILLGLGFIYRGELFPDLELPDFLVPDSGKVAGTGGKPISIPQGMEAAQETSAREAAEAASRRSSAESVPVVPAPSKAPDTEAGTPPSAAPGVNPPEVPPPAQGVETSGETRQPLSKAAPAPGGEVPGPGEGATTGIGEAAPAASTEPPVESQAGGTGPGAGGEAPPFAAETPTKPGISGEAAPPVGSATPPEMAVPGSSPMTATETPSGRTTAGQAPAGVSAGAKPYELLASAREAFWLHNYDEAEKNYRALIELEPQNPDGYGELGNMYFSQGRWEEAAASYYEAGVRLVGEGRLEPARDLVNVIRGLNGKQADDLEKLIGSATTSEGRR